MQASHENLNSVHIIFRSCASSPFETEKAVHQARMLSGQYRVESLTKHFEGESPDWLCKLCKGSENGHEGTLEAMLTFCPSLVTARQSFSQFRVNFTARHPEIENIVLLCLGPKKFNYTAPIIDIELKF